VGAVERHAPSLQGLLDELKSLLGKDEPVRTQATKAGDIRVAKRFVVLLQLRRF
jgi:hypothetical protein